MNSFKIFVALSFATLVSASAFAADTVSLACTKDSKVVALSFFVNDEVLKTHPVDEHVKAAFKQVSATLSAEELQSSIGFKAFMAALDDQDAESIQVQSAPEIVPNVSCEVKTKS